MKDWILCPDSIINFINKDMYFEYLSSVSMIKQSEVLGMTKSLETSPKHSEGINGERAHQFVTLLHT